MQKLKISQKVAYTFVYVIFFLYLCRPFYALINIKDKMIRISFILPCKNVEKYIQKCLDSIYSIALNEDEYEILCVDDNSQDNTLDILNRNAETHTNVYLEQAQTNLGCGGGRNVLLRKAKGEYVWFIDPDDTVVSEEVAPIILQAETNALDVLLFNYYDVTEEGQKSVQSPRFPDTEVLAGLSLWDDVFGKRIVNHIGYVWRFLVRKEYLNTIELVFPERIIHQDTVWMPKLMINATRIQSTSIVAYDYWHHKSSITGQLDSVYPAQSIYTRCITICQMVLDFAKELDSMKITNNRYEYYATLFHNYAVSHYLNGLPLMLCRTSRKERKIFYQILKLEGVPFDVAAKERGLTKMCLNPMVGYLFSSVLSMGYKLTHKRK